MKFPPLEVIECSSHELVVDGVDGGFEVVVVDADDDAQLAGALVDQAMMDMLSLTETLPLPSTRFSISLRISAR